MQDLIRAKVIKLLDVGIIYSIFDNTWEVVPRKSGIMVSRMVEEMRYLLDLLQVGGCVLITAS